MNSNLKILNNLILEYSKTDFTKKISEKEIAVIELKFNGYSNLSDDKIKISIYNLFYNIYKYNNLTSKFENLILEFIPILEKNKSLDTIGKCFKDYSFLLRKLGNYEKSYDYISKAVEIYYKIGDTYKIGGVLNSLGNYYLEKSEYNFALENYYQAFEYLKAFPDSDWYHIVKQNLAKVYLTLGYLKKAKDLYIQDIDKLKEDDNKEGYAATLQGIAEIYLIEKRVKLAYKYARQAHQIWTESLNDIQIALSLNTLGEVYNSFGKSNEAIDCFNKSKTILEKVSYKIGLVNLYLLIGETNFNIQNFTLAIENLERARTIAIEINQKFELRKIYNCLYKAYDAVGDQHSSYKTLKELTILNETFFNFSLQAKVNEVQVNFELEKKELEYNKEREINEYKSSLFSYLTHEFRTPLTLINTPLELIKNETNIDLIRLKMGSITTHVTHMQHLLNQLLDINKIEEGKMPILRKAGTINPLLWHLIHVFEPEMHDKNINFSYHLPKKNIQGYFDTDKIEKIINNLISNAIKYTQEGGHIEFNAEFENNILHIIIKDDGIGIDKKYQKDIFNKFYRIPTTKDVKGSGLGLSFVKELVHLLNGEVKLESSVNRGSVFTVKLPIERIEIPKKTSKVNKADVEDEDPNHALKKKTILLVEDNIEIQKLLKEVLSPTYKVISAEHGREAIVKIKKSTPDIVISDIMMPLMNGIELCNYLKEDDNLSHIPIILLTAKSQMADKMEGLESGADAYITKPFNVHELIQTVDNILAKRKKVLDKFTTNNVLKMNDIELISSDRVFVQQVTDFVLANLEKEELAVEDIASHMHMSRFTLIRKFKKINNTTPNTFIQKIRLEKAKELIKNKVANVTEIAFKVGFSSTTYFSFSFKKEFGMSPKQFYHLED